MCFRKLFNIVVLSLIVKFFKNSRVFLTRFGHSFNTPRSRLWGGRHGKGWEGEVGHSTVVLTWRQTRELQTGHHFLGPNRTALQRHKHEDKC